MEDNIMLSAVYDIPPTISTMSKVMFFVSFINFLLFGILATQFLLYAYRSSDAKRSAKFFAYFVYLPELLQTYGEWAIILHWSRNGSGDASLLSAAYQSLFYAPVTTSLVGFLVRSYACYQNWKLKKGNWYNFAWGIIAVTSVHQLLESIRIAVGTKMISTGTATASESRFYSLISQLWLLREAFVDLVTAITLTSMLIWSNTEYRCLISPGITKLFIGINMLAAGGATATLMSLFVTHERLYFVLCTLLLGKLLLAAINHQLLAGTSVNIQSGPIYSDVKSRALTTQMTEWY